MLAQAVEEKIRWNQDGLICAVAQSADSGEILMLAWMNAEALAKTIETQWAHYYSRSRKKLWKKGEESGHWQSVQAILLDCDGDAIVLKVHQTGLACHTGRSNCFFHELNADGKSWRINSEVVKSPTLIYAPPKEKNEQDFCQKLRK